MRRQEREAIISAYNALASAEGEVRKYQLGKGIALSISREDHYYLQPFFDASYEIQYRIGNVDAKTSGSIRSYFTEIITSDDTYDLVFWNERNKFDFFIHLRAMIEDVMSPLFDKTKSEHLYKTGEEESNGK